MAANSAPNPILLWNDAVTREAYGSTTQYYEHILEQYKLCLELADRNSARRNLANTFFLTLNTLVLGVAGFTYEKGPPVPSPWLNFFPLLVGLCFCVIWYLLIQSYRQLSAAKFRVVGEYERRLPSSPLWTAEWNELLCAGKDAKVYIPLSHVEQSVPVVFAVIYILCFLALVFFG